MKEKVLKYVIFTVGFICLYIFISVRFLPMYNMLIVEKLYPGYWDKTIYGEQYYFNYIRHFREKNLPTANTKHQFSNHQPKLNEATLLAFGDSFFDIVRPAQYPTTLAQKLGKTVYFGYDDFPLQYLNENKYKSNSDKVLIMGITERFIPVKFSIPQDTSYERIQELSKSRLFAKRIKDLIFYSKGEELYDVLLKRSYLTTAAYTGIATLKFDLFGYISRFTPLYSLDDTIPWLFQDNAVSNTISGFYYQHSNEEIMVIASVLENLSIKLKDIYNITFVFMPIPSKYTLYHTRINNHKYNNFLPRLQEELKKRNVHYIDVFSPFMKSNDLLYFGTDGHWNEKGMRMAVDLTVDYLKNNKLIN